MVQSLKLYNRELYIIKFKVKLKHIIKPFKSKKIRLGIVFLILSISQLIGFSYIVYYLYKKNPTITISAIEPEDISMPETRINLDSSYPKFIANKRHILTLNGKQFVLDQNHEVQLEEKDFLEGENIIKIYRYIPLKLFNVKSKDGKQINIQVDRIPPNLEIINENLASNNFLLLDNYRFTIKSEPGALVYIKFNNNEIVKEIEEKETPIEIETVDQNNKVELFAVDQMGNRSNIITKNIFTFKKPGYSKISCKNMHVALKTSKYKETSEYRDIGNGVNNCSADNFSYRKEFYDPLHTSEIGVEMKLVLSMGNISENDAYEIFKIVEFVDKDNTYSGFPLTFYKLTLNFPTFEEPIEPGTDIDGLLELNYDNGVYLAVIQKDNRSYVLIAFYWDDFSKLFEEFKEMAKTIIID